MKVAVFSNIALCNMKLGNHLESKKAVCCSISILKIKINLIHYYETNNHRSLQCDTVLELDPKNVKAYYRRGLSYLGLKEASLALSDFKKVQ